MTLTVWVSVKPLEVVVPVTVTLKDLTPVIDDAMQERTAVPEPPVMLPVAAALGPKPQVIRVEFVLDERLMVPVKPWKLVAVMVELLLIFAAVMVGAGVVADSAKSWIV
jgi:hypothetical protein